MRFTRWLAQGGLDGGKPAKNYSFLVVVAGKVGNYHEKNGDLGAAPRGHPASPNPSTA